MTTIFAVSSGAPPAAIAVIRISGPAAFTSAQALAGALPEARRAGLRTLRDPHTGDVVDRGLALVFPAPHTATGEDLVELHVHGGRAVIAAVEAALGRLPGLRRAVPGEFTRRALAAGRIDLAEAEGLGDLLMAETDSQRRAAMASVEGAVGRAVGVWEERLTALSAQIEALIDFSDEGDVADHGGAAALIAAEGREIGRSIEQTLSNPPVERLRDGIRVVLAGAPNTGKSTLLNALCERDAAIVSPISGTTRDRIEVPVVRNGVAYVLTDTAGLTGDTDDPIERAGIERAMGAIATGDIVLVLDDALVPEGPASIRIQAKADLESSPPPLGLLAVSALTGIGLPELWREIADHARAMLPRLDRLILNARQRALCGAAAQALSNMNNDDELIIAEHLRQARRELDRITGASDTEAMLDALFGRFCIGK